MKVTFIGADHEVTGSCSLLQIKDKNILVDYGMEQGVNIYENVPLPVPPAQIDYIFLTHAHIDHSGNLPLIYKKGFKGVIYATKETCNLCDIMLKDSAHIQEMDAQYKSRKAARAGLPPVLPPYDLSDAEGVLKLMRPCDYAKEMRIDENITIRFTDMGHLLGSSAVEIWLTEDGEERKIVFSGDVGNKNQPIICDPKTVEEADYLVIESTYGDRLHERPQGKPTVNILADVIQRALDAGGNVVIPSFAVGRTQELLYFIREIKNSGMVTGHDNFPVYVDSPLAYEATSIFMQCDIACLDDETKAVMASGENPLVFPGLHVCTSTEDSMRLNTDYTPKVIISSSGMCEAGRIRHHLKYNLWKSNNIILFAGYQAQGTLGRSLVEGVKKVKLFGDEIAVNAKIELLPCISGHADKDGLLEWLGKFTKMPKQIFVNHGDDTVCDTFANTIKEKYNVDAFAPYSGTSYDLIKGEFIDITQGVKIKKPYKSGDTPYNHLVSAAEKLLAVAKENEGISNRELKKFTTQINNLIEKWKV